MTKHKRKVKLGRILILLFILSLLVGVCIYGSTKVSKKSSTVKKVKAISSIEKYDYTLKENATAYYKGLYKELEKILNNDEVSNSPSN